MRGKSGLDLSVMAADPPGVAQVAEENQRGSARPRWGSWSRRVYSTGDWTWWIVRIKPIPKRVLIHTIEYEEFLKDGSFGEEFAPRESISGVLVQPKTEIRRDEIQEEIQIDAVIFLDAVNTPGFKPLKEKSKVHFGGREWRVVSCAALYTFNPDQPHHYEVKVG